MAEYEQKDMTASLFPNDKGDNEKRPDMTGSMTMDGTKYSLSAWKNESKAGKQYLSIKVSEWQERPAANGATQAMDDEIPF
jgi:uncharacterized protein (DUF736 family)